jgi:hypothetical protein
VGGGVEVFVDECSPTHPHHPPGAGQGPVLGFCEHGNELLGCIQGGNSFIR